MVWRVVIVALGGVALVAGTIVVFRAFDAGSHSASDTLRPFLLVAVPAWILAFLIGRALLRSRHS